MSGREQYRILEQCPGCKRLGVEHRGHGLCGMCLSRRRRKDPAKRAREAAQQRKTRKKYPEHTVPLPPQVHPTVTVFCHVCSIQMLEPDETGMCGLCKAELPPYDKLAMTLLPGQNENWQPYFKVLDNVELEALIRQAQLERGKRMSEFFSRREFWDKQEALYGKELPSHHRKCDRCGELAVNCKCEAPNAAA